MNFKKTKDLRTKHFIKNLNVLLNNLVNCTVEVEKTVIHFF